MNDIDKIPKKLSNLIKYLLSMTFMLILAYVDYLTSDYSLVLFYIMLVSASSWYTNIWFGILSASLCAIVEAVSDYYVHGSAVFNPIYYWNWSCNLIIYVTLAIIVCYSKIKSEG
jgi:inner membrane protein involved in colicin E2 resistance